MTTQKAFIYCRTAREDGGRQLEMQESRCRELAHADEYEVVGVYRDVASGNTVDRPGLNEMLGEIESAQQRGDGPRTVIIDDVSRLARRVDVYFELSAAMRQRGGNLASASLEARGEPEKNLMAALLVAVRQFEAEPETATKRTLPRLRNWAQRLLGGVGRGAA